MDARSASYVAGVLARAHEKRLSLFGKRVRARIIHTDYHATSAKYQS